MEALGALEEIVLLIILKKERCHGVEISEEYETYMKKSISLPAIHVVLKRMEKKGLVKSEFGETTPERGGKRKRYYWASSAGYALIKELQKAKMELWFAIKEPSYQYVAG